jgi:DNA-binding beta-propeller fold protein YncE
MAVGASVLALAAPAAAWAAGELNQKPGTAGCISETGSGGACQDGAAVDGVVAVQVSPDGRNVYTGAFSGIGGVAIFDREAATGALAQKPGTAGCVASSGSDCTPGTRLGSVVDVALSPDGLNVYAVSLFGSAVLTFDRDPTTGGLTQKAGPAGCTTDALVMGCTDGNALDLASGVAVSHDGANVYVVSQGSDALAIFDRAADGVLTQKAGMAGCISEDGSGGACQDGKALVNPLKVTAAADIDNGDVYVASGGNSPLDKGAVAVFDRGLMGAPIQKVGTFGCVSDDGTGGACQDGRALQAVHDVAVSPDGANLYAATIRGDAVVIFDRDEEGALTQKAGPAGCVSETGTGGDCQDGIALDAAQAVAASPDGRNVYVGAGGSVAGESDAVSSFDRDPSTGALTQKPGLEGCASEGGTGGACRDVFGLDDVNGLAVSPDSESLYTAAQASDAVAIFDLGPLPEPGGPSTPADVEPPAISDFSLTRRRFRVGPRSTPLVAWAAQRRRRAPRGTRFRFSLSEPADARLAIAKALRGRRVAGRCRAPSRRNRGGPRCTRYRPRGALVRRGRPAGRNAVRFTGRLGRRALRPGIYRATLVATDPAGNRSRAARARFRIVR